MHNWFECGICYEKMQENGVQKKVTEPYLVDALSFTEAESRIIEELKPFISGDFRIKTIKRANINEIFFNSDGDRYFKGKVALITLDEKSGKEKRTNAYMIAQASDIEDARKVIENGMKGTMADYVIEELKETKIMDIFPWNED